MTPDAIEAILAAIRAGNYPEVAARLAGVSPAAMRKHRQRHPEFGDAIEQAEAECEQDLLARLQAGAKDWTARAWTLERRWPDRWSRAEVRAQLTANVNIDTAALVEAIAKNLEIVAQRHADFAARDVDAPDGPQAAAIAAAGAVQSAKPDQVDQLAADKAEAQRRAAGAGGRRRALPGDRLADAETRVRLEREGDA